MSGTYKSLAIIGSGATTIYLLKHILDNIAILRQELDCISVFEKDEIIGMGMPYNPNTTDKCNLANISSEEIPKLVMSFASWLKSQEGEYLREFDILKEEISESEVYSRLALGAYFREQYEVLVQSLRNNAITIKEHPNKEIIDIKATDAALELVAKTGERFGSKKIIIATGHFWREEDNSKRGFYASPWPIAKILPEKSELYNFHIGILGASLSAFDVVSSLSHRHGRFIKENDTVRYQPFEGTENFKLILHDANGWLPHLQYEQDEPMRQIYRHVDRSGIFNLLDDNGYLRIATYFDEICKPALQKALRKDDLENLASLMDSPKFGMLEFVARMSERHEYSNAFEGMRKEMVEAEDSILNNRPIHWKEVIDDLMYCLNYHAELMPAEDHLFFHKEIMPFLMNVIAALPLSSGKILLALYDAGKLELKSGRVNIKEDQSSNRSTKIKLTESEKSETYEYKMFICCGGQKNTELNELPFLSLVENGNVRAARAIFSDSESFDVHTDISEERILKENGQVYLLTGGIDIDAAYRIINSDGEANEDVFDISFTHISGIRPYSYGLQACSATAEIMVESWAKSITKKNEDTGELKEITKMYRDNPDL